MYCNKISYNVVRCPTTFYGCCRSCLVLSYLLSLYHVQASTLILKAELIHGLFHPGFWQCSECLLFRCDDVFLLFLSPMFVYIRNVCQFVLVTYCIGFHIRRVVTQCVSNTRQFAQDKQIPGQSDWELGSICGG